MKNFVIALITYDIVPVFKVKHSKMVQTKKREGRKKRNPTKINTGIEEKELRLVIKNRLYL